MFNCYNTTGQPRYDSMPGGRCPSPNVIFMRIFRSKRGHYMLYPGEDDAAEEDQFASVFELIIAYLNEPVTVVMPTKPKLILAPEVPASQL